MADSLGAAATRCAASSWNLMSVCRAASSRWPDARAASFSRIFDTRCCKVAVARTAAAAGLLSSWVSPADSDPSARSRSRCAVVRCRLVNPWNSPVSRCCAIGNHSYMMSRRTDASISKKVDGSVTRTEVSYTWGTRSPRYAVQAPTYEPRYEVRLTSTSSPPTLRDMTRAPSSST
jgi:hypothetical protein